MKITVVTCYESNEERAGFVYDACFSRGYDVNVITTDFSHIRKAKRESYPQGFMAISANEYNKNLSVSRIRSHQKFAKDAFGKVEELDPDLIWLMAPANSLIKEAKQYKEKHPEKKIIIDIIDMWPESLPVKINKGILPFRVWKNVRKENINCADLVVSECDFYKDILKNEYQGKIDTIHWARDSEAVINDLEVDDEKLHLCYIGSINNIIDTEKIAQIIADINMPVVLHVIGEGENTEHFLGTVKKVCEVEYYGAIRNEEEKSRIFRKCHAGINIYKENLYIGLTVKCIDYFEHGLPIINNIKGDTWKLVEEYKAGINVDDNTVVDGNELIKMRKDNQNIFDLYNKFFTKEVFVVKCHKAIDEVMK